jgi:hypothetical protein
MSSQYYWVIKTKETGKYWTMNGDSAANLQRAYHFPSLESASAYFRVWPKGRAVIIRVRRKDQKV